MSKNRSEASSRKEADAKAAEDRALDDALAESFPASDPPALLEPHGHRGRNPRKRR